MVREAIPECMHDTATRYLARYGLQRGQDEKRVGDGEGCSAGTKMGSPKQGNKKTTCD